MRVAKRHRTRRQILYVTIASVVAASPAAGQRLTPMGSDETLDVATWNIEHFGNEDLPPDNAAQFENAVEIIRQSEIDLWAVQEIDDVGDFHRLIDRLGSDWAGIVDEAGTNTRVGFIYRRNVVSVLSTSNPLTEHAHEFAGRPPLMLEAAVAHAGRTLPMWFITVHMKAFTDRAAYDRRKSAGRHLKHFIDSTPLAGAPVIILGDFNDELTGSIRRGQPSPYQSFVADSSAYRFITMPLDRADVHTWCRSDDCTGGSTIDHILITNELFSAYMTGSAARYEELLDPKSGNPEYTTTTSDHLPVYARFSLRPEVPIERDASAATAIFPIPAQDVVHVHYNATNGGIPSLELFDVLGRTPCINTMRQFAAGDGMLSLDVSQCAAGLYFLRMEGGGYPSVTPFVVTR